MNTEVLQAFIEEAESYLPTIRGGILVGLQSDGVLQGEMETSLLKIHTIKGAARSVGMFELGEAAAALENQFARITENKRPLTETDSRDLLDKISQIEALLLKEKLNGDDFSIDLDAFIEESFTNLQIKPPVKKVEPPKIESPEDFLSDEIAAKIAEKISGENVETSVETTEDEFEVDEEMLEIFALEAEDLLKNISLNLAILAQQPSNREALLEIRRNAHTFKGSAGIVGLKKPSELAHRVEDLLDYMAEHKIAGNAEIFEILLASTDCLSALTSGENSAQLTKKINRLYGEFDEILAALAAPPAVETEKTKEPEITEQPKTILDSESVGDEDSNQKSPPPPAKSVIRVSLEKLDDLVKIVHGLVISRSAFEQRLGEFDSQIEELHHTTSRLQRSTAKLETDFEADMLNLQMSDAGFQMPDSGFQNQSSPENPKSKIQNPKSFDSLEFDRYTEFHQSARELVETASDAFAINTALDGLRGNLETLYDSQRRLIEEMQDKLLRIRMVNFGTLSARLIRTARVTCDEEKKQAEFLIEGENLEIDTQILDSLIEPLLHLLRNSVAHGIESPETRRLLGKPEKGAIKLRAANEGMHVIVTISDDGRGISAPALKEKAVRNNLIRRAQADAMSDAEAYELIFLPGLTTAEKLSQTAGRGVGMNIIKTAVERRQGTISIFSEPQKGTTFVLRLPMALAVTRALLVRAGEQTFAFPLGLVKQITEVSGDDLEKAKLEKTLQFGVSKYELIHLNDLLGLPSTHQSGGENARVLLLDVSGKSYALLVDDIIKPEEIVIKPLASPLQNMPQMTGAAILGDGRIAPVLDLFYLLKHKVLSSESKVQSSKSEVQSPKSEVQGQSENQNPLHEDKSKIQNPKSKIKRVLIVDDSPSVRHLTSNIVKKAGFQAITAKDGLEALEILQSAKDVPDIILSDVEMPGMDGYELLSTLKRSANRQTIPVVMITSRAGEKHRRKAFDLGVSEYLTKPFDDAKLIEIINRLTN